MIYPYRCQACKYEFDVVKSVKEIDNEERCEKCDSLADRYISRTYFYGASDWNTAEFNPGLGCVTFGSKDRAKKAKERGLEEVGNDYSSGEAAITHFDNMREKKRQDGWDKL